MKNAPFPVSATSLACLAALALAGCGSSGGGTSGSGGETSSSGGVNGSGGATSGSGGVTASSGGKTGSGGITSSGGVVGSGGSASGGVTGSGGKTSSGGTNGSAGGAAPGSGGAATASGGAGPGGAAPGGSKGSGGASAGGSGAAGSSGSVGGSSGTGTCPATSTLKVGDNNQTITSGGESRTFIVHVPTGFTGTTPAPVILDFHPLGGTGSQQEGSSGWKSKCDSVGCIAVFPDSSKGKASDNSWNAGYCCTNAEKNKVDDVQFARDIVAWLKTNTCIDGKRIYASGGSNGGGMTYRMACEAADMIAAAAPVDFRCVTGTDPLATPVTAANQTACKCTLPRPITIVAWDEAADTSIVPYGGGQTPSLATDCPPGGSCVGIGFSSAVVNRDIWAKFDMCSGSAMAYPANSLCQTYSTCQSSTSVTLCSTTSGGHLAVYGNAGAKFTDTSWDILKTQTLP
jgi:polyhydroxybutyrate depolymerase